MLHIYVYVYASIRNYIYIKLLIIYNIFNDPLLYNSQWSPWVSIKIMIKSYKNIVNNC